MVRGGGAHTEQAENRPILSPDPIQNGHTLVLRALGSRWADGGLGGDLERSLRSTFGLRVAGNLYVTPPGEQGLAPHYDDHCEF